MKYFLTILSLACIPHQKILAQTLNLVRDVELATNSLTLRLREYKAIPNSTDAFDERYAGAGAFLIKNEKIIYATAAGTFLQVDIASQKFYKSSLPKVDLGGEDLLKSRHINYFESLPRLHDIKYSEGYYYISYDKYRPEKDRIGFEIARTRDGGTWSVIYSSPLLDVHYYVLGNGGRMLIEGNKLFFTLGDYSLDRSNGLPSDFAAQNSKLPWGKVNLLDLSTLENSVFTMGHRNPQGFIRLRNGRLIISEHGPRGGDEINILERGKNYGWPVTSYGTHYGSYQPFETEPGNKNYESPLYAFVPSVAPTQILESSGFSPAWEGDLLIGSLKAMTLYRIRLTTASVKYVEPIAIGQRIRDIHQMGKSIVLLTDSHSFIVLSDSHSQSPVNIPEALSRCVECHTFGQNQAPTNGPNLNSILGRNVGSSNFTNYSPGLLTHRTTVWNDENLKRFIRNPGTFISGTSMPQLNLTEKQLDEVIDALRKIH